MADCISMAASELDRLSIMSGERETSDTVEKLGALEEKIISWSSDESMIWDREPEEASEYLQVVDEMRILIEDLGSAQSNVRDEGLGHLLGRAHRSLQTAMARLVGEFAHLLLQNQQPVELEHLSFRSVEDDFRDYSSNSFDEELIQDKAEGESGSGGEEFVTDLIHPNAVADLRCIVELMFLSNYDNECCQTYIGLRKDAMDEYLLILHKKKLSIEEVLRLDWRVLNTMIRRWNQAMKLFILFYLTSEKRLLDLVFGELPGFKKEVCFLEISKGPILQLLNFADVIALGPPKTEKLFRILQMYHVLEDLLVDVESLFPDESGSGIINECHEVLLRLGELVKGILAEFKGYIQSNTSTVPFASGGVHNITNYVMNYIKILTAYNTTLMSILENRNGNQPYPLVTNDGETNLCCSPIVPYLQSVISLLETNIEGRSMLYRDPALQSFFLMNNIWYMVQKVMDFGLLAFLGEDWARRQTRKIHQHVMVYERTTWTLLLSSLKEEGIYNSDSSPSMTVLKERLKRFNIALEEIYRTQTAWRVPDPQLRDDLRISVSLNVLQAYRTFMGRYSIHFMENVRNWEKYIKYWPDDLEKFLLDLYEGSPKMLH